MMDRMHEWIEKTERAALEDIHAAATPELRDALDIESLETGSAFASIAGGLPASAIVLNRAAGLGAFEPETRENVTSIVQAYRRHAVERFFIQTHPDAQPPEIGAWLEDCGLKRVRSWQTFVRGTDPIPERASNLEIRRIGPKDGTAFARIVCDAFDLGDAAKPWFARIPGRESWHIFMSFSNGEPAGAGGLFIHTVDGERLAWTDFGATDPKFRMQGSQSALLRHRIAYAIDQGCRHIFTCTGEAVPGDPQHSYRNIEKMGFSPAFLTRNYAPY